MHEENFLSRWLGEDTEGKDKKEEEVMKKTTEEEIKSGKRVVEEDVERVAVVGKRACLRCLVMLTLQCNTRATLSRNRKGLRPVKLEIERGTNSHARSTGETSLGTEAGTQSLTSQRQSPALPSPDTSTTSSLEDVSPRQEGWSTQAWKRHKSQPMLLPKRDAV